MRAEVVHEALRQQTNQSAVAHAYHVSRQTVYKWVNRYRVEGVAGLQDRSSRPQHSPTRLLRVHRGRLRAAGSGGALCARRVISGCCWRPSSGNIAV